MQTYIIQNTQHKYPLVIMTIPDVTQSSHNYSDPSKLSWKNQFIDIGDLRTDEIDTSIIEAENGFEFISVWSKLDEAYLQSGLSISRTIFVCLVLSIASFFFTNDANVLVLSPLERMLEKVKLIAKNPLAAGSDEVQDAGIYSMMY